MQTTIRSSTLVHHLVTLLIGAVLAAGIWLLGYAEVSWLGFIVAAILRDRASSHQALARPSRRPMT